MEVSGEKEKRDGEDEAGLLLCGRRWSRGPAIGGMGPRPHRRHGTSRLPFHAGANPRR